MIGTWMMAVWLCASPGPGGECAPVEHAQRYDTRGACIREARALKREDAHVHARCTLDREAAAPPLG